MQGGLNSSLMWLLVFVALTYFLMIRPQSKQKKKRQDMLNNLEKKDKIITIGGIHGTIVSLKDEDNLMVVEIAPNVRITMQRSAVGSILTDENADVRSKDTDKDKSKEIETVEDNEKNN